MGKAQTVYEALKARPVTAAELKRRREATALAGEVRAMPGGRLAKFEPGEEEPREWQVPLQVTD